MVRPGLALILFTAIGAGAAAEGTPPTVSFRKDVAPILATKCLGCHGEKKASGGLSMATFSALKRGGKSNGPDILTPGDPEASVLIEAVRPEGSPRMPLKLPPLSDAQVRTLTEWVRQGARFDGPSESATPLVSLVDVFRDLAPVPLRSPASDPVTSLSYSPDGSTLAVAAGRSVVLVDASAGKPGRRLTGHPGPVASVRYSPDGTSLIAAGGRAGMFGAVTVWDAVWGDRLREARGHADAILAADLSPDGRTLATGGYDRTIVFWDFRTLRPLRTLNDHTDAVIALAFSADGALLASASADRTVKLWDPASGKRIKTLADSTAELYAVAFSPDGSTVFAGGVDRSIRAWKAAGTETTLVGSVFAHDAAILRLVVDPERRLLISSGEDRAVKLWDLATLAPRSALPGQSDWPQGLAVRPDGRRLSVGRHDGSVGLYDLDIGKPVVTFSALPPATPPAAPKPELVRSPTLNPPSPRGATRGRKVRVTLSGRGVGTAKEVVLPEPGLAAVIVPPSKPDRDRLEVDLTVAADARVGLHRIGVVTPLGVPGSQPFAVDAHPAADEAEPNDDPARVAPVALPATLVGTVERPGDVDHFRFRAEAGQALVFAMTARPLGSALTGMLTLLDDQGREVARSPVVEGVDDPILAARLTRSGTYSLRIADVDYEGSGNHFYRISAGPEPYLEDVFPLGVAPGRTTTVHVRGRSLAGPEDVPIQVAAEARPGSMIEVPIGRTRENPPVNRRLVAVVEGAQADETERNDDAANASPASFPGGAAGRIGRAGDLDHFRVRARKGERMIVEVFARRLGTPLDPFLEVLDAQGRSVPRAVLRPVAETEVAFRDHNSSGAGIRLTKWNNLAVNDTVLIGREVTRIFALPRNPDDDCQFWSEGGRRFGFLETTPEHHPMGQPIYKVEVHPPGSTFPAGGQPTVTLDYSNDDGGPGFGKDARVTFDPPADGDYVVRVGDARGLGGEAFAYHVVFRRPRPDFTLSVNPEEPNVPRGSTSLVAVNITRLDGFDGPVLATVEDLPPGVTSTPAVIERGMSTANLALSADPSAPSLSPPSWTLSAREVSTASSETSSGEGLSHRLDPKGPKGGRITVWPEPNLRVAASPRRVTIRAGGEASMTLSVSRSSAFTGRVPIDVRNLPHGVRVLDVGLNGVLVTEKQTERAIRLYAEPWAAPGERPFYAVGKAESAGTEDSSPPITLVVEPPTRDLRLATPAGTASAAARP